MSAPFLDELAGEVLRHPNVARMAGFHQHGRTSTLAHAAHVAELSLRVSCGAPRRGSSASPTSGARFPRRWPCAGGEAPGPGALTYFRYGWLFTTT